MTGYFSNICLEYNVTSMSTLDTNSDRNPSG